MSRSSGSSWGTRKGADVAAAGAGADQRGRRGNNDGRPGSAGGRGRGEHSPQPGGGQKFAEGGRGQAGPNRGGKAQNRPRKGSDEEWKTAGRNQQRGRRDFNDEQRRGGRGGGRGRGSYAGHNSQRGGGYPPASPATPSGATLSVAPHAPSGHVEGEAASPVMLPLQAPEKKPAAMKSELEEARQVEQQVESKEKKEEAEVVDEKEAEKELEQKMESLEIHSSSKAVEESKVEEEETPSSLQPDPLAEREGEDIATKMAEDVVAGDHPNATDELGDAPTPPAPTYKISAQEPKGEEDLEELLYAIEWSYVSVGPDGKERNQFFYTLHQLAAWYKDYWFDDDLMVKSKEDRDFFPLSALLSAVPSLKEVFERPPVEEYVAQQAN